MSTILELPEGPQKGGGGLKLSMNVQLWPISVLHADFLTGWFGREFMMTVSRVPLGLTHLDYSPWISPSSTNDSEASVCPFFAGMRAEEGH